MAEEWDKMESLAETWEWAKLELSTEELNNKLLLAKDRKQTDITNQCGSTYSS